MTSIASIPVRPPHPIRVVVDDDDLQRRRLTVFFRPLLAVPHFVWIALWGVAAAFALLGAWVSALAASRVPDGLHRFLGAYLRYVTQVTGYITLAAGPYPRFTGTDRYAVDARIEPAERQGRWSVLFRMILAVPAAILLSALHGLVEALALLQWFYALWTTRAHRGMRDLTAWCIRFQTQTVGYLFLLTDRYPAFEWEAPAAE